MRGISSFEFSWPAPFVDVETRHVTCKFSSSRDDDQLYKGKDKLNIATSQRSSSRRGKKKREGGRGDEILTPTIFDRGREGGGLFKRSFDTNETLFHREFVKRDVTSPAVFE